jgi:hypothetical protein
MEQSRKNKAVLPFMATGGRYFWPTALFILSLKLFNPIF